MADLVTPGDLLSGPFIAGLLGSRGLEKIKRSFLSVALIYRYTVYLTMESTTVKVSKDTLRRLAVLQRRLGMGSLDDTIQLLVTRHKKELLDQAFGADRGRLTTFGRGDRGEDRS